MNKINPFNVMKMLYEEFDSSSKCESEITENEIELKNQIFGKV